MVQSLQLGGTQNSNHATSMRRVNRLPVFVLICLAVAFLVIIFFGLTGRGLYPGDEPGIDQSAGYPASSYADQLKQGVADGIIGEPQPSPSFQPSPVETKPDTSANPFGMQTNHTGEYQKRDSGLEEDEVWRARLQREQDEQYLRERQRQRMARLQANAAAHDAPLALDPGKFASRPGDATDTSNTLKSSYSASQASGSDLYAAALRNGLAGQNFDPNGQASKQDFFNSDIRELGYLPNRVVPQRSPHELKRGSVIPATLISGINSDLPGRITAQVSQNIYDSATGHRLLIPQGAKLFGRYDSKIAFGQRRVLAIWTDIIFPNGSTLQIGAMAAADVQGYGGFKDKVNNHYLRTFGSAALIAMIGTGIDMAMPESSTRATQDTASDAARRNFAESFGRVAERTINRNLDVQPTLEIRPGYQFNVVVDQDMVFPAAYEK